MRDLTYVKLIFFGKKPETELADAKYDGQINPLDFIQIKLIIVDKEKELTFIDTRERIVTVKKPIRRIIIPHTHPVEMLRTLKVEKDKIVGVGSLVVADEVFFPEFKRVPNVGFPWRPDIEAILNLHPDVIILHPAASGIGSGLDKIQDTLESVGIGVLRFGCNNMEIQPEETRKLGYIFDKEDEAEQFLDFRENFLDLIEERVEEIPEEDKPKVYYEDQSYNLQEWAFGHVEMTGGRDIFADLNYGAADLKVDPEAVVARDPDIIVNIGSGRAEGIGYGVDADNTAKIEEMREAVMSRPELQNVRAVKDGRVYVITPYVACGNYNSGTRGFLEFTYLAKWFHPELFENLDPKAIHQEYLTRFQGLDIDLDKNGVFVYPEPS
jgi:iron complex transport system substrate-binding protein